MERALLRFRFVKRTVPTLVIFLAISMLAASARAQVESRFAIGGELTVAATDHASNQDRGHSSAFPELLWRFGEIQPGWGPHWGLNWYSLDIDRPIRSCLADFVLSS